MSSAINVTNAFVKAAFLFSVFWFLIIQLNNPKVV